MSSVPALVAAQVNCGPVQMDSEFSEHFPHPSVVFTGASGELGSIIELRYIIAVDQHDDDRERE